jgi:hypothetical protein
MSMLNSVPEAPWLYTGVGPNEVYLDKYIYKFSFNDGRYPYPENIGIN